MLFFGILSVLLAVASANYCYDDVGAVCGTVPPKDEKVKNLPNCSAKYGSIVAHLPILQSYANTNIAFSMDFLLMSSYFGNYEYQREGFQKLYRKYSDEMWEDAIDVIKYLAKRGGTMDFEQLPRIKGSPKVLEMNELSSLAKALDSQKLLANEAMHIYTEAQLAHTQDSPIAHYIEERFFESHTKRIRELAGYAIELKNLLIDQNPVSVFLFDEYLKKSL